MAEEPKAGRPLSDDELQDLVASSDTGARDPGGMAGRLLFCVALAWSLFQIWIASPLPFVTQAATGLRVVLNDTETRSIHLAFALFLAFCAFPALPSSPRNRIPVQDWVLALLAAFCAAYIFLFYGALATRPGNPLMQDLVVAGVGLILLLEATRRALGLPLVVVAVVFLLYVFFGSSVFVPDVIRWKGASIPRAMDQMWLSTEGVFGIALGVSSSFVFLFVLFGSLLDRAGAGNYFIKLAFALLGHLRGGPAKAAVLASAMTGLISGSSIANVVTTGTFTIPLMKRVGFTPEKAGSVEVASSVNGQIMPPVMGAAAFLMVEYVGISYLEVIKAAFLPAIISYIALLYLVHLEAVKHDMPTLPKRIRRTVWQSALVTGISATSIVILCGVIYWVIRGVQMLLPDMSASLLVLLLLAAYVGLVWYASRSPDLELDDPNARVVELPLAKEVLKTGLHYLLPIVVLVWFLMIEQKSPGLSAFWAVALLLLILVTQKPLKALFRGLRGQDVGAALREGADDLFGGLVLGARNMIGIAAATATAGIIVGTVTLTGIGQVMAQFVELISGGNLLLILFFTAVISLILGMGLPTTANYIVVSSLMAPVVVELGAANGFLVPLIAVHLFVFYFGIMADVTPPVGLASFAAAAVSGGDPIRTGVTAFFYSLRTVLLPFIFIFNTDLLLIDVSWAGAVWIFLKATIAMLVFAAATQNFFLVRSRLWESAILLLAAFFLLRPGFFLDQISEPYETLAPARIEEAVASEPDEGTLRLTVEGPDFRLGRIAQKTIVLELGAPAGDPRGRLEQNTGLLYQVEGDAVVLEEPFDATSQAAQSLKNFDFYGEQPVRIVQLERERERMNRQLMTIPGFLLIGLVVLLQRRRQRTAVGAPATA